MNPVTMTGHPDPPSIATTRALDEVAALLTRKEHSEDPRRTDQIRRWVAETAERFRDAPIQNFVPILVEHIVRDRMYQSPPIT